MIRSLLHALRRKENAMKIRGKLKEYYEENKDNLFGVRDIALVSKFLDELPNDVNYLGAIKRDSESITMRFAINTGGSYLQWEMVFHYSNPAYWIVGSQMIFPREGNLWELDRTYLGIIESATRLAAPERVDWKRL
jgi:hypothetical protein